MLKWAYLIIICLSSVVVHVGGTGDVIDVISDVHFILMHQEITHVYIKFEVNWKYVKNNFKIL